MKIVAYFRVSTKRQGISGLGLDAQRQAVQAYATNVGGRIVAEYTEIESGRHNERQQLAAAITRARAVKATLVIAKLDRLARNVAFVSRLMESGCDFVCCDNPQATKLVIHILAAVAQAEVEAIKERIKAALAAAKRRGTKLGTHRRGHVIDHAKGTRNGLTKAVEAAAQSKAKKRADCYSHLLADLCEWRDDGDSFAAIAARLNDAGHITTSGKPFAAMTVKRIADQCCAD